MSNAQQLQKPKPLELKGNDFHITIPRLIYDQIMHWIHKAGKNEISGFGTVTFNEKTREFTVEKAILLDQENNPGHTEIDPQALAKAMYELREEPGEIRWWWHSHVQMGVFWSMIDMDTIQQLGGNGWILATVFNQKEEKRSALLTTMETPLAGKHEVFADEIPTAIVSFYDTKLFKEWDKTFDEKVKEKKYLPPAKATTPLSEAALGNKALDQFTWFTSPHFKDDLRFEWSPGYTENGVYVWGKWKVVEKFKGKEEVIIKRKLAAIVKALREHKFSDFDHEDFDDHMPHGFFV